jgi:hypothetical protein
MANTGKGLKETKNNANPSNMIQPELRKSREIQCIEDPELKAQEIPRALGCPSRKFLPKEAKSPTSSLTYVCASR